jgi:phosphate transporter
MELLTGSRVDSDVAAAAGTSAPPKGSPRSVSSVTQTGSILRSVKQVPAILAVIFFLSILHFPGDLELEGVPVPAARKCMAILVCVSTLWATEAIPLYVTSLLVPLLTVGTGALLPPPPPGGCAEGDKACGEARFAAYPPHLAAREICAQFFEPTVLLFLAGFSIGAALEKHRISQMIASVLLRPFGNKPENVLLGIMLLGMFLSMWISNIPASVLCVSLSQAIVHQLPAGDPFAKALLLGVAFRSPDAAAAAAATAATARSRARPPAADAAS